MSNGRILSIQSHVVHGHVGNRAAVFPLQLLEFEVDFINSVQFSNHTQYKCFKGQRLNADELDQLFDGLRQNDLLNYTHLLTGYVGDKTFLNKLADLIEELKIKNPNIIYLCDPVLGDNGHLVSKIFGSWDFHGQWTIHYCPWTIKYVAEELVGIYLNRILPKANIITPNIFELELIYGNKIESQIDIFKAIRHCHEKGIDIVIISSSKSFDAHDNDDNLILYASKKDDQDFISIQFKKLPGTFYGTGDAFAAMVLAWFTKLNDLKSACEHAISAMIHILNRTNLNRKSIDEMLEIKLIQSKRDIENPAIIVKANLLPKLAF